MHLQRLELQLSINIVLFSTSVRVSFFLVVSPHAIRAILFVHKSLESAFIPVLNAQPHVKASFRVVSDRRGGRNHDDDALIDQAVMMLNPETSH